MFTMRLGQPENLKLKKSLMVFVIGEVEGNSICYENIFWEVLSRPSKTISTVLRSPGLYLVYFSTCLHACKC